MVIIAKINNITGPSIANPGELMSFRVDVANIGDTTGNIYIDVFRTPEILVTSNIQSLASGEETSFFFEVSMPNADTTITIDVGHFEGTATKVSDDSATQTVLLFQVVCTEGSKRCNPDNSTDIEECINNAWVLTGFCNEGECVDGECVQAPPPPIENPSAQINSLELPTDALPGSSVEAIVNITNLGGPGDLFIDGFRNIRIGFSFKVINFQTNETKAIIFNFNMPNIDTEVTINTGHFEDTSKVQDDTIQGIITLKEPPIVCTALDRRCDPLNPNSIQECQNNAWVTISNCSEGCLNGECIEAPPDICTQNETRCDPSNSNVLQQCQDNVWVGIATCAHGCVSGECNPTPEICVENSLRCSVTNPNAIEKCIANKWLEIAICEDGCINGECDERPPSDKILPVLLIGVATVGAFLLVKK